ncbi:MAG: hypothetical protein ACK47B_08985 [Armatimonadota bacterium]
MNPRQPSIEMEWIERVETIYRQQVEVDPSDHNARISLAWCFFIKALHHSGRESLLRMLSESDDEEDLLTAERLRRFLDADTGELLSDTIRHTVTARHLSRDPEVQMEVTRLEELIMLSSGAESLPEAERTAWKTIVRVTRELFPELTGGSPRLRRRPTRRRRA